MRKHHTKNKGDLGVLHAQLDLARRGYAVLLPLTEHEAFDVVAYKEGRFLRVQVKYRAAHRGIISVPFRTSWADRHGTHTGWIDKRSIDVMCVYCPDTDRCYYVDPQPYHCALALRLLPSKRQRRGIHLAEDFTEIPATVGVPPASQPALVATPLVRHSREPRSSWFSAHSSAG